MTGAAKADPEKPKKNPARVIFHPTPAFSAGKKLVNFLPAKKDIFCPNVNALQSDIPPLRHLIS